jgi:hypothetical protein
VRAVDNDAGDGIDLQNYSGTSLLFARTDGYVGIGTTGPGEKLTVNGNISLQGDSQVIKFYGGSQLGKISGADVRFIPGYSGANFEFRNYGDTATNMIIQSGGNVGIGTTDPGSYKLYVNGNGYVNGTLSGISTLTATTLSGDLSCTDCVNATEIEDIYVFNTSDTMSGSLGVGTDLTVSGGDISITNNNGGIDFNDASAYWLKTATNWGLYWDTTANTWEWHAGGVDKWSVDLSGNVIQAGDLTAANVYGSSSVRGGSLYMRSGNEFDSTSGGLYLNWGSDAVGNILMGKTVDMYGHNLYDSQGSLKLYDTSGNLVVEIDESTSPIYWEQTLSSQFIEGTFYQTITSDDQIYLDKDPSGNYYSSGTYTSVIRDSEGTVRFDTFRTITTIPSSTKISAQVQVSDDNFASIKDSMDFELTGDTQTFDIKSLSNARYVRVKFDFETNDTSISPHLISFEVWSYLIEPNTIEGNLTTNTTSTDITSRDITSTNTTSISNTIFINSSGKVGIGIQNPSYKLDVDGDVRANSFINVSTAETKKDISFLNSDDYEEILGKIASTSVATYLYTNDPAGSERLGLIAENAPREILSADGKGVDLYKMNSFVWAGLKGLSAKVANQQKEIKGIEQRLSEIEAKLNPQGGVDPAKSPDGDNRAGEKVTIIYSNNSINFLQELINGLAGLGISIKDGIITAVKLVAEEVKTKILRANVISITVEEGKDNVVGTATIPPDSMEYQVKNSLVQENSKIFISFTSNTGNRTWYISEKKPDEGFVIKLNEVAIESMSFDYWILLVEQNDTNTPVGVDTVVPASPEPTASSSEPIVEPSTPVETPASVSEPPAETPTESGIQAGPPNSESVGGEPQPEPIASPSAQ